jgi:hypothetical protein
MVAIEELQEELSAINFNEVEEKLAKAIFPIVYPRQYSTKQIEIAKEELLSLRKQNLFGKLVLVKVLTKLEIEPYILHNTDFIKMFPNLVPKRSLKDAWKVVFDNGNRELKDCKNLIISFIKENKASFLLKNHGDGLINRLLARMVQAALYWDANRINSASFLNYFFSGDALEELNRFRSETNFLSIEKSRYYTLLSLEKFLEKNPDATLKEIANFLNVSQKIAKSRLKDLVFFRLGQKRLDNRSIFFSHSIAGLSHQATLKHLRGKIPEINELGLDSQMKIPILNAALRTLTPKEEFIIRATMLWPNYEEGAKREYLLKDIGEIFEKTVEAVRQEKEKILGKLKKRILRLSKVYYGREALKKLARKELLISGGKPISKGLFTKRQLEFRKLVLERLHKEKTKDKRLAGFRDINTRPNYVRRSKK